eukprot:96560-Rhodomonas_salina.2
MVNYPGSAPPMLPPAPGIPMVPYNVADIGMSPTMMPGLGEYGMSPMMPSAMPMGIMPTDLGAYPGSMPPMMPPMMQGGSAFPMSPISPQFFDPSGGMFPQAPFPTPSLPMQGMPVASSHPPMMQLSMPGAGQAPYEFAC